MDGYRDQDRVLLLLGALGERASLFVSGMEFYVCVLAARDAAVDSPVPREV